LDYTTSIIAQVTIWRLKGIGEDVEDIFLKLVKFITTLLAEVVILHLSNLKGGHSLK